MKHWILASALAPVLAAAVLAAPVQAQTTLNVRDADIRAFIADAAKVTGRTFIIDSRVQGKVTVVTDRPLSRSEYFEVFLSTLRANGLVTVPTANGALRVQPIENAAANPGRIGSAGAARNQFVTEIVRLRSVDAQSAVDTVRPLVSAQGSVSANRAGSSIVIADFADNVRRVREVLRRIDTDNNSTRVIALRNAGARDIATALQGLIGTPAQGQTATASVVAVEGANSVALRGDPTTVARLAQVAADLDQKAKSGTEIRVVFLEHADAGQLLPVLQQLVGQTPDTIPQNQLSQSNFGASTNGGNAGGQPTVNTGGQTQSQAAPGGGASGTPAVQAQGGRAPAVVTRFVGANAIVIAAPADIQRQLSEVVRQLDTRREQVLVEAIVAEVSDQTASRLGFQFLLGSLSGGAFGATSFSNTAPSLLTIAGAVAAREIGGTTTTVVGADGSRTTTSTPNPAADALAQQALNSVLGASGAFGGYGGTLGGDTVFGAIINAVKSDTTSNLLQAPSLITLDNQEARILVGQEIPITTGEALSQNFDNAFRTVQRENVGIQLEVRPQVNSSGSIKLFLHQQVSSIAGPVSNDNSDLILNKREVETTLTVDDGQIAIIGGLLSDDERRTLEKLPLLGDIPVLGNLFRSKGKQRTKTNLMVFIRPTILRTPEDNRRVTEQRYGYLRLQQGLHDPAREPSIDELVRDYMGAAAPIPSAPVPGNIEDPRIQVPVQRNSAVTIKRRDR
ncbi:MULTISPECIES: type II secretion system secretin GspD [Sphingomonas]|jgi:general secretion pathway protein D|uniref:Type II secretion system protein GspD n=1 Tax=Sphingomonas olei TaxID=1886787 RepID=A0ABY2QDH2_9SPHN|nr:MULTISPECIES: type II secretion system secretin GspD [Sphingomonas]KKI18125.1 type II secretion system protein D [Sphingomonas sp. Ag1]THG37763.1 type II secretion system protein GspD [Sphingomonas olei]